MAEFNIPNKKNHTVMAGSEVWIARYDSNDALGDYSPVGNLADDLSLGFDLTRLEHKTNQYGIDTQDRNPVISKGVNFKIPIDELVRDNLLYALGSSARTVSQTIRVRKTQKVTFASGIATINSGSAVYAVDDVLPISGEDTYDEGATGDYTVNLTTGVLTLTGSSNISNGDKVHVRYRVTKTATKYPIMDDPNISGAVQFVNSLSSANELGYNMLMEFDNCDISVDGEFPLSKKDWSKVTLMCNALADAESPTSALGNCYLWRD